VYPDSSSSSSSGSLYLRSKDRMWATPEYNSCEWKATFEFQIVSTYRVCTHTGASDENPGPSLCSDELEQKTGFPNPFLSLVKKKY